jgi:hypothetical protein
VNRGRVRAWLLAAMLVASLAARADDEIDLTPAIAAAERWLHLLDEGRYGASWDEAAPMFQEAMSRHRWETTLPGVRDPLGVPITRKMRQARFTNTLPNSPAGEYVVIQFDTRFETRPLSTEIVTPMKVGGHWLVSGYIIR